MNYLFKLGSGWEWSKIYFDTETDSFINEKYHEEYLDTGTICDGASPISDEELWELLVRESNEKGIEEFLKIRKTAPVSSEKKGITIEEFWKEISSLVVERRHRANGQYKCTSVGNLYVLYDDSENIIGVISKSEQHWIYVDTQTRGFNTKEEAFEYALERVKAHYTQQLKFIEKYGDTRPRHFPK